MALITRAQWGAAPAEAAEPLDGTQVDGLAFHWPATTYKIRGVSAVSAALRSWQRAHMAKGWRDIAYQVAVDQDGNRYILRGLDGMSAANGDVIPNKRYGALLLVLAAGEEPTQAMIKTAQAVVKDHRLLFPRSKLLLGHQDVRPEPTACPGPIVMKLLDEDAFEPQPSNAELIAEDIRDAIIGTKTALAKAASRPRVRFRLQRALEELRLARDINKGE